MSYWISNHKPSLASGAIKARITEINEEVIEERETYFVFFKMPIKVKKQIGKIIQLVKATKPVEQETALPPLKLQ